MMLRHTCRQRKSSNAAAVLNENDRRKRTHGMAQGTRELIECQACLSGNVVPFFKKMMLPLSMKV